MSRFENREYENKSAGLPDLVCLSHLRWDFVYQRPQHLLSRFARERRVLFVEEPIFDRDTSTARLDITLKEDGVYGVVPHLPEGSSEAIIEVALENLLNQLFADYHIADYILWYYTPMALGYTRHLRPQLIVYDCMDELSLFKFASPLLASREVELFGRADLVFTGGASLYEVKRQQHQNVHLFPSSIDKKHFSQARNGAADPEDQKAIPHPRLGFFGVIDERMDLDLLSAVAVARPDWHLVMVGPVVKVDHESLPKHPNIHYMGGKSYKELPSYLAGWDVAMLPFARNDSTRFISPTKTPEYLAGGKPVVSTPIRDVIRPYGERGLVWVGETTEEFIAGVESALKTNGDQSQWLQQVDEFLAENSWDLTWNKMRHLIQSMIRSRRPIGTQRRVNAVPDVVTGD